MSATGIRVEGGAPNALGLLLPKERVTFLEAAEDCKRFTGGHQASFAVRMAFWELAEARRNR